MLTLQFVPFHQIENLSADAKIQKLLALVKENKIVLLEGRLRKTEEVELIKATMREINDQFKGIEVSVVNPEKKNQELFSQLRSSLANLLLGDRQGLTIIGPASIIKEIKKEDLDNIQLLTEESNGNHSDDEEEEDTIVTKRGRRWSKIRAKAKKD